MIYNLYFICLVFDISYLIFVQYNLSLEVLFGVHFLSNLAFGGPFWCSFWARGAVLGSFLGVILGSWGRRLPAASQLDRQCRRACGIRGDELGAINPLPPDGRPHRKPFCHIQFRAWPAIGASIKKLLLATFVVTACYADLRPGSEFELLLGTFVITAC